MNSERCQSEAARERARQARSTSRLGVGFQGVYAVAQFVILAILIRTVGAEQFGYWITVYAASQWATLAQLGIPKALVMRLSRATPVRAALIRRAVVGVTAACGVLLIALLTAGWWLPWQRLLQAPAGMDDEAARVAVAALGMALVTGPLTLGGAVLLGRQRGALMHAWAIVGQLAGVALVASLAWSNAPLWGLALAVMSAPVIAGAGCWALVLGGWGAWENPALERQAAGAADAADGALGSLGLRFVAVDLATVALMQSGPILLAWARDPGAVAVYAAAFRPVGLLMASFTSVAQAYWPAFGDADAAGDRRWLWRGVCGALRMIALIWLIGSIGILLVGRPFIAVWLGPAVVPDHATLAAALLFAAAQGGWAVSMALLSGLALVGRQVIAAAAAGAVLMSAGFLLARGLGPAGMYAGQAAAALVATAVNAALLVRARRGGAATRH
jgi:O-antigen/teichoic acid export membrane protein